MFTKSQMGYWRIYSVLSPSGNCCRNGTVTYAHQLLGAAFIHPDKRAVIPLMPEPIVNQDGSEKNDCERNAAKRFVTKFRRDHPHLKVIVTEDSLSSNAPHIETLHA